MDSSGDRNPVEALAEEFMDRKRRGETPAVSEYTQKYPQWAEEIEDLFPALELMEDFKPLSDDLSDGIHATDEEESIPEIHQIGDYRVLKEIGRGGMGVVYEAEQRSLGRRVAIKVLPRTVANDEKSLARFQREARAAAKMHHTNIVPVFEVGQDQEHVFYAMQLIQGQGLDFVIGDLKKLRSDTLGGNRDKKQPVLEGMKATNGEVPSLAASLVSGHFHQANLLDSDIAPAEEFRSGKGPAYEDTVLASTGSTASAVLPGQSELSSAERNRKAYFHSVGQIGLQTARALSYAHARGIIHRDIKPSNLLLDTTGVVWVTDFGLAKTSDAGLTHTGDILGTLRYMSPERFKGQCDVRADVYSLGLTLFELVTLKPAFESPDRLKLIDMVAKTEMASPRTIDSRIPLDLETIILKASDKDPKRRYQSADDMAEDLQRFVDDEPILARRTTTVERLARWSRRNPWLATAMSIAVLALVAVAGVSTFAAQAQSQLNGQLVEEQNAQEKLLDEQRVLNDKLASTIQANEQLIADQQRREADLKRSTATLAEKQAEFVAERGNIAEAMHWLSRSFELSEGKNQNLLARLSVTAQQMPRLHREIFAPRPVADLMSGRELFERLREQRNSSTEPRFGQGTPFSSSFQLLMAAAFARSTVDSGPLVASDQGLLALKTNPGLEERELLAAMQFWDLDSQRWTGSIIDNLTNMTEYAIDPKSKQVAMIMLNPGDSTSQETSESSNGPGAGFSSPTFIERFEVRNLVTGKLLFETEKEVTSRGFGRRRKALKFIDHGARLLKISPSIESAAEFSVETFDCQNWEVERRDLELNWADTPRFIVSPRLGISRDNRRLIFFSSPPPAAARAFATNQLRRGYVACFDVETGTQIGQQILIDRSAPLVTADDASQVAIVTGVGGQRRVEIHDFESGVQVGESIELSLPVQVGVRLLNVSVDQSKIIVAYSIGPPRRRQDEQNQQRLLQRLYSLVQVFDLETGQSVTPPLPAHGQVESAHFSDQDQTLSVRDALGIRVWDIVDSTLHPVILPNRGPRRLRVARGGFTSQNRSSGANRSTQVRNQTSRVNPPPGFRGNFVGFQDGLMTTAANQQIAMARIGNGIRLTAWDGRTGRMFGEHTFPDTMTKRNRNAPLSISPGGSYLLVRVGAARDESSEGQVWRTDSVELLEGAIKLERGENLGAISPDGKWIAVTTPLESGIVERTANSGTTRPGNRQNSRGQRPEFLRGGNGELNQNRTNESPSTPDIGVKLVNRVTGQQRDVPIPAQFNTTVTDPRNIETAFSANGKFLAVASSTFVQVLDLNSDPIVRLTQQPIWIGQARRFSGGRFGLGRGGETPIWAISHDATMIADVVDESALRIRQTATRQPLGELMIHPAAITAVSFGTEGRTVVTACEDGLVRQWSLPETWSGTPEEIRQRVEEHTGLQLVRAEDAEIKRLVESDEVGAEWSNHFGERQQSLSQVEQEALRLRHLQDWPAATTALERWQALHPDDWLPAILKIRPLVEQQRLDEAKSLLEQASEQIDQATLTAWIRAEFSDSAGNRQSGTNLGRGNNVTEESAAALRWQHELLLGIAQADLERANHLLVLAKVDEVQFRFDEAIGHINQAVALVPDSANMHYYRAHLMARLSRWDEEIVSRHQVASLDPDDLFAFFRYVCAVLDNGTMDEFWGAWHASVEARQSIIDDPNSSDSAVCINRDLIAKPRLVATGDKGHLFDLALEYADQNYGHPYAEGKDIENWFKVCKGIAEYRRGHWKQALEILEDAFQGLGEFNDGEDNRGQAICRFFAAMAFEQLGEHEQAKQAYLKGLDLHHRDRTRSVASTTTTRTDWHLAEVARRESEQLLEFKATKVGLPLPDTKDWVTIFKDSFDDQQFGENWQVHDGNWKIEDGAARGEYTGRDYREFRQAAIDLNYEVPVTAEIEFQAWWPHESMCELKLLPEINIAAWGPSKDAPPAHTVGLSGYEHHARKIFTWHGNGAHLLDYYPPIGSNWMDSPVKKKFLPDTKYTVRVLQQPERITVHVDDGSGEVELFNERISGSPGKFVRLYGLGTPDDAIYFDNLKIRAPKTE